MPDKSTDWTAVERDINNKAYRKQLKDHQDSIKRYADALADAKLQLAACLDIQRVKTRVKPIEVSSKVESEAAAFALAGDWHVEETVKAASVNGLNEFTPAIAEQRIRKFTQSTLRLVDIERAGTRIDTLVVPLLGDHMTGYIHEELQETNSMSPTQTIIWLRDRILSMLETFKREGKFKRIIVPCCYGNHGRTTRKPRHATGAANSYEWLLYQIMARHMPDVEWHIAESYHTYLDIYKKTIRIHHGDGINYQGGIGGLTIPLEKAIASWNKARVADLDIHGHWHTQQQNPKWVSNGSLIGYNAYSVAIKAPFEPPQQTFFLFDSKRGRTGTFPIFLS